MPYDDDGDMYNVCYMRERKENRTRPRGKNRT